MISYFLELIDRLIDLKQVRIEHRRELLDRIVDPAMSALGDVHRDYIRTFESARDLVSQGDLDATRDFLRKARLEYEPVRERLKALSEFLANSGEKDLAAFANGMYFYFEIDGSTDLEAPRGVIGGGIRSISSVWVEILGDAKSYPDFNPSDYPSLMDSNIGSLRTKWALLCQDYARIQTRWLDI